MTNMTDTCTCCNGYTPLFQLPSRYSFPKKLLVAISIVVIITMCVMPAEARSLEHRKRHQRRQPEEMTQSTKDDSLRPTELRVEHKKRHQRRQPENIAHQAKDPVARRRSLQIDLYKNVTRKIIKKLKNTRRYFNEERKELNESREYRDGMPSWLPSINFVDIHYHDYKSANNNGTTVPERKFAYLMPKLYKTLKEYEEIFKLLLNVELDYPDDAFINYKKSRDDLIRKTKNRLYSTTEEIFENIAAVKMTIPRFDKSRMNLQALKEKVDATQCLKNDYIAFRGYGNLLNIWYLELTCSKGKKGTKRCAAFESKMKSKRCNKSPAECKNLSTS